MSDGQNVQSTLEDMDRKLRELQRELAMVAAPPEEPETSPPPAPATAPPPLPPRPESAFPAGPIAGPGPAPAGASVPPSLSGAQADAARIIDEAAARVTELGKQVDDLQRLREELQRSTAALAQEYHRAFDQEPPPAPAPAAPYVPPPPAAVAPPAPLAPPSPAQPPSPAPAAAAAAAAPPPAPLAPPAAPPPAAAVSPSDGHAFEGDVVINAGPFLDIATVRSFEQALAQLPQAEEVYVRGFEGNRALIDLRLGGPIHLVDEMRRALPFSVGVVEVGNKLVTINVDLPAGGASAGTPAT